MTVTSANVHGLSATPEPPVDSAPAGNDASAIETDPVQGLHIKGVPQPSGN